MNLSAPFIRRPIGTILLTVGVALAGISAFFVLPVAPLPQVDYPAISVSASLSGASPQTMASSVATPLERRLGIIPGVNEMTSESSTGSARINLQFDLDRDIDGAAREVQAAISAARADLPATLKGNPTYRKQNSSDSPMITLALTSDSKTPGQIYEAVSNIVQQKIAQVKGVGDVEIGGGSLPAVRVEMNPYALNHYGVSMEDVRTALQSANANRPKGTVEGNGRRFQVYTNDTGRTAADYRTLIIGWRNNSPVRIGDIAEVLDSVEDTRTMGLFNGNPAVLVLVTRQPGANIVQAVDAVRALVPELSSEIPSDIKLQVVSDTTNSIRASLKEIEVTLMISVLLVILVVGAFLRSLRATLIPAVATLVSLLGTFGVMYLLGFSLNNLSLMAVTVATGFVIDDAIVVLENTMRHIEQGMGRMQAALLGAREVGFTVLSISVSLIAVFIPLLFMGGQVGRLFREFAITLSVAVVISLLLSLTTTPMMCAHFLKDHVRKAGDAAARPPGRLAQWSERMFTRLLRFYERCLDWALENGAVVMLMLATVTGLSLYLYTVAPKGFFPQTDNGQIMAGMRADESVSFQAMAPKLQKVVSTIAADPAVDTVFGFTGGTRSGGGFMFVNLKPVSERKDNSQQVIARLRPQLSGIPGLSLFLNPVQDLRMGARSSNSTYQYTLQSDSTSDLKIWSARLAAAMALQPELTDVDSDSQENGRERFITIDRDAAARFGISNSTIDNALYNSFGQRQATTIYNELNQYHVVMEVAPQFAQSPDALNDVYVPASITTTTTDTKAATAANSATNNGLRDAGTGSGLSSSSTTMVPLSTFASFADAAAAGEVRHQSGELATTISFNLADGKNLGQAKQAIKQAEADIGLPNNVHGSFQGTARSFQETLKQQPILVGAALVVIYLVLGILYESLVHPITVLTTLPSAGVGAVLALLLFNMEFSIIALIGVFLLLGIVKKNAIMVIDFALDAERSRGLSARAAVREACLLRFRPIVMTTLAAGLGVLPLAIGFGEGAELRRPLGVAVFGGLIASQLLTLLTTPVVYVYLDRRRRQGRDERHLTHAGVELPVDSV
ncbi:MAG: efflux RND transporter permease subunit [Steroidobacteraceae bacterium]